MTGLRRRRRAGGGLPCTQRDFVDECRARLGINRTLEPAFLHNFASTRGSPGIRGFDLARDVKDLRRTEYPSPTALIYLLLLSSNHSSTCYNLEPPHLHLDCLVYHHVPRYPTSQSSGSRHWCCVSDRLPLHHDLHFSYAAFPETRTRSHESTEHIILDHPMP